MCWYKKLIINYLGLLPKTNYTENTTYNVNKFYK